jgi:hypothetical protein
MVGPGFDHYNFQKVVSNSIQLLCENPCENPVEAEENATQRSAALPTATRGGAWRAVQVRQSLQFCSAIVVFCVQVALDHEVQTNACSSSEHSVFNSSRSALGCKQGRLL